MTHMKNDVVNYTFSEETMEQSNKTFFLLFTYSDFYILYSYIDLHMRKCLLYN